jgi:hypothetical protein
MSFYKTISWLRGLSRFTCTCSFLELGGEAIVHLNREEGCCLRPGWGQMILYTVPQVRCMSEISILFLWEAAVFLFLPTKPHFWFFLIY